MENLSLSTLPDHDDISPIWGVIGAAIFLLAPVYMWLVLFVF